MWRSGNHEAVSETLDLSEFCERHGDDRTGTHCMYGPLGAVYGPGKLTFDWWPGVGR